MDGPGSSDVDDFNARKDENPFALKSIPKILIDQWLNIPTVLDWQNKMEPVFCKSCIQAYCHSVFIINGCYILKRDDAITEAKRIKWGIK